MNDPGHRAAGAVVWFGLAAAQVVTVDPLSLVLGAAMVSATSSNDFSPDIDQRGWPARLIPGGHRGPTHMPELVAIFCGILLFLTAERGYGWVGAAISVGWGVHLFTDMLFGSIPFLVLGGGRAGFALRTGGATERALTWGFRLAAVPLFVYALIQGR